MYCVYIFKNKINDKIYIGKTNNIERRNIEHLSKSKTSENNHFYNAIKKYGLNSFIQNILHECEFENEAYQMEEHFIALYKSNNKQFGYNSTSGGEGLHNINEETRKKMSEAAKLRTGDRNGFYNKEHSIKSKLAISKSNKGKKSFLGKHHTDEAKSKISKANFGKRYSLDTEFKIGQIPSNAKITIEQAREIRFKNNNGTSSKELRLQYNLSRSQIYKIINYQAFKEGK